jgi:AcrR family transcriptional regulator
MVSTLQKSIRTYSKNQDLVDQRRTEIVLCASAVFVKNGYDSTSMTALAKAFGMSKGGLYHYIGSKNDILLLILRYYESNQKVFYAALNKTIEGKNPREALFTAINYHIDSMNELQEMQLFINQIIPLLDKQERKTIFNNALGMINYVDRILQSGIESGDFVLNTPTFFTAQGIVGYSSRWVNYRWMLRKMYSISEYKQYVWNQVSLILGINSNKVTEQL